MKQHTKGKHRQKKPPPLVDSLLHLAGKPYVVQKGFKVSQEPFLDEALADLDDLHGPLIHLTDVYKLPEPYWPLIQTPTGEAWATLAWCVPITSTVDAFIAHKKAFGKAIERGELLPWFIQYADGRPPRLGWRAVERESRAEAAGSSDCATRKGALRNR